MPASFLIRETCLKDPSVLAIRPQSSGVDLAFATVLTVRSQSKCQIQNSTKNLYLLVMLILTFAKVHARRGCKSYNRTTSRRLGAAVD